MQRIRESLAAIARPAAFLGILILIFAASLFVVTPQLGFSLWSPVLVGVVLLLIYFLGNYSQIRDVVLGPRGRYGVNTAVMVIAFIAIAVLANFMGSRNHQRFDVTASKQFSLSPQTIKILHSLEKPVKAVGFFNPETQPAVREEAERLLTEYSYQTPLFSKELVDPDEKAALARQMGFKSYGDVIFESEGRRQRITTTGEQEFTGAILSVTGLEQKKVYFLVGHGEADIAVSDINGLSEAERALLGLNYEVRTLNFAQEPEVPRDAAVLVIAAPKKTILPGEVKAINDYLDRGGKALILMEPDSPPELVSIIERWGLSQAEGTIIDQGQGGFVYPDPSTPLIEPDRYPFTQITKEMIASDRGYTFFPNSAALMPTKEVRELLEINVQKEVLERLEPHNILAFFPERLPLPDDISITPLAITTLISWLEPDATQITTDIAGKKLGPFALAASVEATARPGQRPPTSSDSIVPRATRLVVIGDVSFAINRYINNYSNGDLFLNSVNWLAEREELISIRPKPPDIRFIVLNPQRYTWTWLSSVVLLPTAVLVIGAIAWWRRR